MLSDMVAMAFESADARPVEATGSGFRDCCMASAWLLRGWVSATLLNRLLAVRPCMVRF